MEIKKIAGIYSTLVGISMIGMWLSLILTNQVLEIQTEPIRIFYHLIAEFLTAAILLIAGFGLLTNHRWGFYIFLLSMGMLLYTVIVSAGYYAQKKEIAMLGMFTILQIITIIFIFISIIKSKGFKTK